MKTKKLLALFLSGAITLGAAAGCSSTEASKDAAPSGSEGAGESVSRSDQAEEGVSTVGFPIVKDKITLSVFGQQGPVHQPWDTMGMWKKYQEMTNIDLDFENVLPAEGFSEKKNLMWSGGEYQDVFVRAFLSNAEIVKYGTKGILIPLEELMETYAPNMSKHIQENPAILSRITAPDGHIYALPALFTLNAAKGEKFWMNTSWLKKVNKEIPTDLTQLEDVLNAFAKEDFNGNGIEDEYPMGASDAQTLIRRFAGVWGHQWQFDTWLEVKDDVVLTYITSDSFKEELQWLSKIYAENLIDPEIFTQEYAKYASKMAGKQMGLFFNQADDTFDSSEFVGIAPFKGAAEEQYVQTAPIARDNGVFAISSECENPEAALRWIDYFYSEEGSIFMRYGVEGENMFFDEAKKPHYNDGILNSEQGSGTEIAKFTIWPGGGAPQWVNENNCEAIASKATLAAQEALEPFVPKTIYAAPLFDEETNDRVAILWNDIDNYFRETTAKFIRGESSFDEWDTYVKTLNEIGLEEWVGIYQSSYDSLKKAS